MKGTFFIVSILFLANAQAFAQSSEEEYMIEELEELVLSTKGKNAKILDPLHSLDLDDKDILSRRKGWSKSIDSEGDVTLTKYTNTQPVKKRKFHLLGLANSRKHGEVRGDVVDIVDPGKARIVISRGELAIDRLELNSTLTDDDKEVNFENPLVINKFGAVNMDNHGLKAVTKCFGANIPTGVVELRDRVPSDCTEDSEDSKCVSGEAKSVDLSEHSAELSALGVQRGCVTIDHSSCQQIDDIYDDKEIKKLFNRLDDVAQCTKVLKNNKARQKSLEVRAAKLAEQLSRNHSDSVADLNKYAPSLKENFNDGYSYPEAKDFTKEANEIKADSFKTFLYKKQLDELKSECREYKRSFKKRHERVEVSKARATTASESEPTAVTE